MSVVCGQKCRKTGKIGEICLYPQKNDINLTKRLGKQSFRKKYGKVPKKLDTGGRFL